MANEYRFHLGDYVYASGYLIKVRDGVYIAHEGIDNYIGITPVLKENANPNDPFRFDYKETDLSGCDGDGIKKTLYKIKEEKCKGIVVGVKDVCVKEMLYTSSETNFHTGVDRFYVGKYSLEMEKCAVVYYSNCKKHLVPLRLITEYNHCSYTGETKL